MTDVRKTSAPRAINVTGFSAASAGADRYDSAMGWPRSILHVDMDAFFAAVAVLDDPSLKGKPVLIGGTSGRGVVSTASYEARVYGCRSAQPMSVAMRLCPQAIVVKGNYARYREIHEQFQGIFENFTPLIQTVSIDEAFLDVGGTERLFGDPVNIAKRIRERIKAEIGLTASVGVAPNKFLAKLASDLNKPDGLTVIGPDDIDTVLPPLSLTRMWGIGPKTAERLSHMGLRTFGDLRKLTPEQFVERFGSDSERFRNLVFGIDARPVTPDRDAKSVGQEETFGLDLVEPEDVRAVLLTQVEEVARRLRKHQFRAGGVTVKIRDGQFHTVTRSCTLDEATDLTALLWQATESLFNTWAASGFRPIRLIGMQATSLTRGPVQMGLFDQPNQHKQKAIDKTLDTINAKFGKSTVRRARGRGER